MARKRVAHSPDVVGIQVYDPTKGEFYPAISLDYYKISDIDESGDPAYYGYLDIDGNWYIMEYNVAAGTCRYFAGITGYTTAWGGRALLEYGYFDVVF